MSFPEMAAKPINLTHIKNEHYIKENLWAQFDFSLKSFALLKLWIPYFFSRSTIDRNRLQLAWYVKIRYFMDGN